ncbi:hypothetical protein [Aurantimonas sp. 22II-16-19i]|uniref:hypothetical protein n=1 Tax=Aurantimonas sp. 22II-16-19i TaxID=1317114 RepID=UPI0009F7D6CA|nr:hypothetical protein [Aurantimonas sp. 22II-16-19i]ORE96851.1 hypothetical protein ATO4_11574 [Aurantimonas sp. 22II-16-19i]
MAGILLLLFFAPLAAIHGRRRARALVETSAGVGRQLLRLLTVPMVVLVSLTVALLVRREQAGAPFASPTGGAAATLSAQDGIVGLLVTMAGWIGEFSLILFFLAIPYVIGSLIAAALLILHSCGEITLRPLAAEPEEPAS